MSFDPLANIPQLIGNPLEAENKYDRMDSEATHRAMLNAYKQFAVITSVDDESSDRYFVDIYSPRYMKDATHANDPVKQDVIAHASNSYDVYEEGDLVRVVMLANEDAIIVSEKVRQLVVITALGPSGEATFTDNRYWAKLAFCSDAGTDPTTSIDVLAYPEPLAKTISFTNINEDPTSHGDLAVNDFCYLDWEYDLGNPTHRRWLRDASVGIKQIRYDTTAHKLQYTYAVDPVESDWIDITTAVPCTTV